MSKELQERLTNYLNQRIGEVNKRITKLDEKLNEKLEDWIKSTQDRFEYIINSINDMKGK